MSGLARPFFAIFAVLLIGAATAFYRYFMEPGAELMLIVGLWTSFNLVIAGVALGVVAERREPDRFPRLTIAREGLFRLGDVAHIVSIHSVSAGGCSIRFAEETTIPASLIGNARASLAVLPLGGETASEAMTIDLVHATRGEDATTFGFSFADMSPKAYMALADLMYGDPDAMLRFVQKRRSHKNLLAGSWAFLRWGVLEPLRAISYVPKMLRPAVVPPVVAETVAIETVAIETIALAAVAPTLAADEFIETTSESVDVFAVLEATIAPADAPASLVADDFATLAADLLADHEPDVVADVTADWMNAVLTLAAAELKRSVPSEEVVDAASVAA